MTTGERIAARRDELGLKQYQVAEQIGVTKTTMSKYENNVNIPNADILARLASVLRTSADYLCGITDNSAPLGEKMDMHGFGGRIADNRNKKAEPR